MKIFWLLIPLVFIFLLAWFYRTGPTVPVSFPVIDPVRINIPPGFKPFAPAKNFSILFGGDVMLGRSVNTGMQKRSDYIWPFQKIAGFLKDADITFVNLESPFNTSCPSTDTGMIFCADPSSVEGLTYSGIDIVSLANNHIGNQGDEGLEVTQKILKENHILTTGLGEPAIINIGQTKVALVGFNDIPAYYPGISRATKENIRTEITTAKQQADVVIATFHWGAEYSPHNKHQTELAHLAIDSGADAVIGHHPHWVQGVERFRGKPIYYSLGNLVFDQMWSEGTRNGLLVKLVFSGTTLVEEKIFPIYIVDYGQAVLK